MPEIIEPFEFKECINILKPTGERARNLRELKQLIAVVSEESIFYHIYHYFLKGYVLEYTNDFAYWAGECLEERALSEHLSGIDLYSFKQINELRNELLYVIDNYIKQFPTPREAMPMERLSCIYPRCLQISRLLF